MHSRLAPGDWESPVIARVREKMSEKNSTVGGFVSNVLTPKWGRDSLAERIRSPLARAGLRYRTHYVSRSGSHYLGVVHDVPRFTVLIRLANHDPNKDWRKGMENLPELEGGNFYMLDLRFEDHFPHNEEELLDLLVAQNPGCEKDLVCIRAEMQRLESEFARRFGDNVAYYLDFAEGSSLALAMAKEFQKLLGLEVLPQFVTSDRWWNGPTGAGIGYYTMRWYKNGRLTSMDYGSFRLSLQRGGPGDGIVWLVILVVLNDACQKRALITSLEKARHISESR